MLNQIETLQRIFLPCKCEKGHIEPNQMILEHVPILVFVSWPKDVLLKVNCEGVHHQDVKSIVYGKECTFIKVKEIECREYG